MPSKNAQIRPNYGIDAPEVIRNLLLVGIFLTIAGWFLLPISILGIKISLVGFAVCVLGLCSFALGLAMVAYVVRGKFNIRDLMLNLIDWQGHETVLDIGTGRGLLAIGAAKRLTTGKSIGIDIWRAEDLSDNKIENTLNNIELESVKDRVEIKNEDVRKLSFSDNSFDVILSLLCIHNIDDEAERAEACREIARVLKPGGTAVIGDYIKTAEYAKVLAQAGLEVEKPKSYRLQAYALMSIVVAKKPA